MSLLSRSISSSDTKTSDLCKHFSEFSFGSQSNQSQSLYESTFQSYFKQEEKILRFHNLQTVPKLYSHGNFFWHQPPRGPGWVGPVPGVSWYGMSYIWGKLVQ
uniref:Uncharacterized protein n=1 Tax=Cacopsylla melanoneura TaxID=428564 RepID=A0A8D8WSM9_9HEMI